MQLLIFPASGRLQERKSSWGVEFQYEFFTYGIFKLFIFRYLSSVRSESPRRCLNLARRLVLPPRVKSSSTANQHHLIKYPKRRNRGATETCFWMFFPKDSYLGVLRLFLRVLEVARSRRLGSVGEVSVWPDPVLHKNQPLSVARFFFNPVFFQSRFLRKNLRKNLDGRFPYWKNDHWSIFQ